MSQSWLYESTINFTDLCKPVETYVYARKKAICKLSRSKAPKRIKLAVTDIRQKPVDLFYWQRTGVDFSSRNIFPNLGFSAKVSVPIKIYNSLLLAPFISYTIIYHHTIYRDILVYSNLKLVYFLLTRVISSVYRIVDSR